MSTSFEEFKPENEAIASRYATKMVDSKFYAPVSIVGTGKKPKILTKKEFRKGVSGIVYMRGNQILFKHDIFWEKHVDKIVVTFLGICILIAYFTI